MKTTLKLFMPSVAIIASNLLLPVSFYAEASDVYISGSLGMFVPNKIPSTNLNTTLPTQLNFRYSVKPKYPPLYALGLGCHVSKDFRIEAEYMEPHIDDIHSRGNYVAPQLDANAVSLYNKNIKDIPQPLNESSFLPTDNILDALNSQNQSNADATQKSADTPSNIKYDVTIDPEIRAVYFKLYYDLFKIRDKAKIYVGTGLGVAVIRNEYRVWLNNDSRKFKDRKTNFSYLVAVGASYDITSNFTLSAEYNYLDFGKSRDVKIDADIVERFGLSTNKLAGKRLAGNAGLLKASFRF
jgi:hypothetical protein